MEMKRNYFYGLFAGLGSLLTGMGVTLREFFTRKTTECYPENRSVLKMYDRFRGTLELVHNERNEHRCVACGLCEMNCPNGTIRVHADVVEDENGKKKKVLRVYEYDLGSCIFCQLCVVNCPHQALRFSTEFEHAVFTREKLVRKLNREGAVLEVRKTEDKL
ncbi:MAG: 4Fe-4S binding protein [Odoribacter sp.]|nr:4Fe-4S binding protein [Odoribacter sp.]